MKRRILLVCLLAGCGTAATGADSGVIGVADGGVDASASDAALVDAAPEASADASRDGSAPVDGAAEAGADASGPADAAADATSDASDAGDAGLCSLPPVGAALAVGEASRAMASYTPTSTFSKALFARDTRNVDRWVVVITNDPDACTTLSVAPVAPANCVSTPAAYQYLLARYTGASVPAGTDAGGSAYSFGNGVLYFSQGLTGSYVLDSPIDAATAPVQGRFFTCDTKTSAQTRGAFNAAYCPLAYFPCNS
ncbi:MAG TPA: hypothetical protein PLR99_20125 [Polyangiaceae bacterium]|nr:hypothetical protein [Polyangiaceae bacterium]